MLLLISALTITFIPPASAMEGKAFDEFLKSFDKARREDVAKALETAQQFVKSNELTPSQIALLYSSIANVQQNSQKDVGAAIATLEEGLNKMGTSPERFRLVRFKADALLSAGRVEESEAWLTQQWPELNKTTWYLPALPTYVKALQKLGKNDTALDVTRTVVQEHLETLAGKPETFQLLINQLLATGRTEEAASWGKLYYMVCPFDERSLQAGLQMLSRIWTAEHVAPAKVQELLEAQQDSDSPSPLQSVKLPALNTSTLRKRLGMARQHEERFVLQLALRDIQDAMTQARRLMLDKPESPIGVLLVCRAFKARDLKLTRANAFLEFYKTGQGVNPLTEFQREVLPEDVAQPETK